MDNLKRCWELFYSTFAISATTSGGWTIVSIMKTRFVEKNHWLEEDEMMDLLSIAQSTPGPVAINASVLVGYRVAGLLGAIVTLLGTVLPPLIIMSIVAITYQYIADNKLIRNIMRGMQAGSAALLASVTIDLFIGLKKQHSIISYLMALFAFIVIRFTNINVFIVAIVCALAGIAKIYLLKKEAEAI